MSHWVEQVEWVEWLAALLALGMVVLNALLHPAAWPLALCSSLLYLGLFWDNRLYGQFLLQWVFAAMALWGWWQWRRAAKQTPSEGAASASELTPETTPRTTPGSAPQLAPEAPRTPAQRLAALAVTAALWAVVGAILAGETDAAAPWMDALPTAGSLVATWMLGRRWPENWWWWLGVNGVSTALFLQQGLLPTAGLYAVFAGLSAWGWWTWRRLAPC